MRQNLLAGMAHQDYPFDLLLTESGISYDRSRNPLFDVGFTFSTYQSVQSFSPEDPGGASAGEMTAASFDHNFNTVKADLWFHMNERENEVKMAIDYNIDLFRPVTVGRMVSDFLLLTELALCDPAMPIDTLVQECNRRRQEADRSKRHETNEKNHEALKALLMK